MLSAHEFYSRCCWFQVGVVEAKIAALRKSREDDVSATLNPTAIRSAHP